MTELTISARGRITLPPGLLIRLGAKPGDRLVVEPAPQSGVTLRKKASGHPISACFGILAEEGGKVASLEEMGAG